MANTPQSSKLLCWEKVVGLQMEQSYRMVQPFKMTTPDDCKNCLAGCPLTCSPEGSAAAITVPSIGHLILQPSVDILNKLICHWMLQKPIRCEPCTPDCTVAKLDSLSMTLHALRVHMPAGPPCQQSQIWCSERYLLGRHAQRVQIHNGTPCQVKPNKGPMIEIDIDNKHNSVLI